MAATPGAAGWTRVAAPKRLTRWADGTSTSVTFVRTLDKSRQAFLATPATPPASGPFYGVRTIPPAAFGRLLPRRGQVRDRARAPPHGTAVSCRDRSELFAEMMPTAGSLVPAAWTSQQASETAGGARAARRPQRVRGLAKSLVLVQPQRVRRSLGAPARARANKRTAPAGSGTVTTPSNVLPKLATHVSYCAWPMTPWLGSLISVPAVIPSLSRQTV